MSTIDDIQQIVATRQLASFIDRKEDAWFEAKSAAAYDLNSPAGRWELAKDVSAFANANGGFIVVGLNTERVPEEQTDKVIALDLLPQASFVVAQIQGVLREYLFPNLQGLDVQWFENADGNGQGVGVIHVPEQPQDRRFTLMVQTIDEGVQLRRFVFGFVRRLKSATIPLTVEQLHDICQNGRSSSAERLTRIEEKVDHLIVLNEEARQESVEQETYAAEMERRLNEIISHVDGK